MARRVSSRSKRGRAEEPGVPRRIFNVAYLAGDEQLNNIQRADLKASVTLNLYVCHIWRNWHKRKLRNYYYNQLLSVFPERHLASTLRESILVIISLISGYSDILRQIYILRFYSLS